MYGRLGKENILRLIDWEGERDIIFGRLRKRKRDFVWPTEFVFG